MLDSPMASTAPGIDVAIVGAGPYGLSIAAHLRAANVSFRIFGQPMNSWTAHMPRDMLLKSAGFASNLSDPQGDLTLAKFCLERGIPYSDSTIPISRETFAAYGTCFQERFVPEVERRLLVALDRGATGFWLRFDDGELVVARRVILAVGVSSFPHVPPELRHLPAEFLSHSSQHSDLQSFAGRRVAVIGAGASAIELSHLLHEAGAATHLVARRSELSFLSAPTDRPRPMPQRLLKPMTGMGPGWRAFLYENAPYAFRLLPQRTRRDVVSGFLPAEGGWFSKQRLMGRVPLLLGHAPRGAEIIRDEINLHLSAPNGTAKQIAVDHIITATGYQVDVAKLPFLSAAIQSGLKLAYRTPLLSREFESTVPGLYFVGLPATLSFGPLCRFVLGGGFTARR